MKKGVSSLIILAIFLISFATIINMNTTTTASTTSTTTYNQYVKLAYHNVTYAGVEIIKNVNTSKYYRAAPLGTQYLNLPPLPGPNGFVLKNGILENQYTSITYANFYNVTTTYYILSYYYPVEVNISFAKVIDLITQKILAYNFTLISLSNGGSLFNTTQGYIVYSYNGTTVFSTSGQLLYNNSAILPFIVRSATLAVVKVLANTTNITSTTLLQNATLSKPPQVVYIAPTNLYTTLWYYLTQSLPTNELILTSNNFSTELTKDTLCFYTNYSTEINNMSITYISTSTSSNIIITIISKTPIAVAFNESGSSTFEVIKENLGYYLPNGTIEIQKGLNVTAPISQFTQYNYSEIVIDPTSSLVLSPTIYVYILAQPIKPPNYIISVSQTSISSTQYNANYYSTTSISQNTVNQANISSPVSLSNNTLIYTLEQHKEAVAIGLGILLLIMIIVIAVTTAEGGRFK